jgi:hypothetical protein
MKIIFYLLTVGWVGLKQCCESGFIESGSRSRSRISSESGPGFRVLMTKNLNRKNSIAEIFKNNFSTKLAIYFFLISTIMDPDPDPVCESRSGSTTLV